MLTTPTDWDSRMITGIETAEDAVIFTDVNGDRLRISWELSGDSAEYDISDPGRFEVLDGWLRLLKTEEGRLIMVISINHRDWYFTKDNGSYYYVNAVNRLVKFDPGPEKAELFPDSFLSGRGRIWNYSIPLLKRHLLSGSGANTFVLEFPQNDYLYKGYVYDRTGSEPYDVKPHCFYLQQWIENGLPALLLLLSFFALYLIRSIRLYLRTTDRGALYRIGLGCFTAVLLNLTGWLVNDSNICTAPVFWVILGIGIGINQRLLSVEGSTDAPFSTS
ncbi:MAG: O-antigen ligase family protein [Lachnospiraceae bacterium]|nr:O-antigen ligase family protein [Lachnospiraceae bacterium]